MNGPLKLGVAGENVRMWQIALGKVGQPVTADSRFGVETQKATIAVQKKIGVTADGIVGKATEAALTRKYALAVGIDWTGEINRNTTFSMKPAGKGKPAATAATAAPEKAAAGFPWIIIAIAGGVGVAILTGKGKGKGKGKQRKR